MNKLFAYLGKAVKGVLTGFDRIVFQAVGFFRVESCPTQAVLPLVGLAAEKVIRDRYILKGTILALARTCRTTGPFGKANGRLT